MITIDEVYKYKDANTDMLPEIEKLYNTYKNKKEYSLNKEDNLNSAFICTLNKLSDSNYSVLAKDLLKLNINKEQYINNLINLIIHKCFVESKYCSLYAKLSTELSSYYIKENDKQISFRDIFVKKCQSTFNDCVNHKINKDNAKTFFIFLGELYNCGLLSDRIITICFQNIFNKIYEDNQLLFFSTLLKTTTQKLVKINKSEHDKIIKHLTDVKNSSKFSMKDKFLIMDLLE